MLYIASPYTANNADKNLRLQRYLSVRKFTAQLLMNNIWCYSPIVHNHELAETFTLPKNADYWQRYNEHILRRCDALVVHQQPGWQESPGVGFELDCAIANGVEIYKHSPDEPVITFIEKYIANPPRV